MSQSTRENERTFLAENDLSSSQYYIVKLGTNDNEVALSAAATDGHIGVLQNDPTSGESALVRFGGTTKVEAGGSSISKGDPVTANASGQATNTSSEGDRIIGFALEGASAGGDIIEVLLAPGHFTSTSA